MTIMPSSMGHPRDLRLPPVRKSAYGWGTRWCVWGEERAVGPVDPMEGADGLAFAGELEGLAGVGGAGLPEGSSAEAKARD